MDSEGDKIRRLLWARKEGQDPDGGLNAKGRASYNSLVNDPHFNREAFLWSLHMPYVGEDPPPPPESDYERMREQKDMDDYNARFGRRGLYHREGRPGHSVMPSDIRRWLTDHGHGYVEIPEMPAE